jgi:adenylate kinase
VFSANALEEALAPVKGFMKTVFVAGVPESGRSDILRIVLRNEKKRLPVFSILGFDELVAKSLEVRKVGEVDLSSLLGDAKEVRKFQEKFSKTLDGVMVRKARSGKNLVIDGYFTIETPNGEIPLISDVLFREHKLNMIINMELEVRESQENRDLMISQDINRNHAANLSSLSGAELKTVVIKGGNYRLAINELTDSLEFVFG